MASPCLPAPAVGQGLPGDHRRAELERQLGGAVGRAFVHDEPTHLRFAEAVRSVLATSLRRVSKQNTGKVTPPSHNPMGAAEGGAILLGGALRLKQDWPFGWGGDEPGPGRPAKAEKPSSCPAVNSAQSRIVREMLWTPPAPVVVGLNPVGQLTISNGEGGVRLVLRVSGPVVEDIMVFGRGRAAGAGRSGGTWRTWACCRSCKGA
jgi:hypothetical protein